MKNEKEMPSVGGLPQRDPSKPIAQQGLFHKFDVRRVDGSDKPGGKHHDCSYFVLDLTHDQNAAFAMRAYAAACRHTHPQLASDIAAKFGAAPTSKDQWVAENLNAGEVYAGIVLGLEGQPDHHLVLLPGTATEVTWQEALEYAAKLGGKLPTRREQALLYANLKHEFEPRWYWSGEQHAAYDYYAWTQDFYDGNQDDTSKSARLRARAVRRLSI